MAKIKVPSLSELAEELTPQEFGFKPTNCYSFDLITAGKGLPLGKLMQLYSDSGLGKSTAMLSVARGLCQSGVKVLYAAVEPNKDLAVSMGMGGFFDDGSFMMLAPQTYSDLEKVTWAFFDSDFTLLVIDSITACRTSLSTNKELGIEDTSRPAIVARIRADYLRNIQGEVQAYPKAIIYLNQMRANFGGGWNAPATTVEGGNTGKFYCHIQTEMIGAARVQDTSPEKQVIGTQGFFYAHKNRVSLPLTRAPFKVIFGKGISNIFLATYYAVWKGYITRSGSSFNCSLGGKSEACRGREARDEWVRLNIRDLGADFYQNAEAFYNDLHKGYKWED